MLRRSFAFRWGVLAVAATATLARGAARPAAVDVTTTVSLGGSPVEPPSRDPHVDYTLNLDAEHMVVRLPKGTKPTDACGLVVYVDPGEEPTQVPAGWGAVLDRDKLIFASPENAGNKQPANRRTGLAVFTALRVAATYKVDPARVYAAGLSGGARVAGELGFYQPDLFRGTIQCCGADYPTPVPQVAPRDPQYATDADYGHLPQTTDAQIAAAKAGVRFAFLTGSRDFRHGFILDLFHGGYEKDGFQAKLIDVPGAPHAPATGPRFEEALAFVEGKTRTPPVAPKSPALPVAGPTVVGTSGATGTLAPGGTTVAVAPPGWAAKPTDQWPQILLENDFKSATEQFGGASGFLMRLPTGQTVAVTARHVFGDTLDVAGLEKATTVWTMNPRGKTSPRVRLKHVAWDPAQLAGPKPLDCVVMTTDEPTRWPAEVLTPRQTPPVVGETVYLLGVPYGDKAAQHVYKGVVTAGPGVESMFAYEIAGPLETKGFSGAPVLDANGLVLGIHHGKYDAQPGGGRISAAALDVTAVLSAARPPASAKVAVGRPAVPATPAAATPAATAADAETTAGQALDLAQNYVVAKRYDTARTKLQALIAKYPGTAAAGKAKQVLKSLPQGGPES